MVQELDPVRVDNPVTDKVPGADLHLQRLNFSKGHVDFGSRYGRDVKTGEGGKEYANHGRLVLRYILTMGAWF